MGIINLVDKVVGMTGAETEVLTTGKIIHKSYYCQYKFVYNFNDNIQRILRILKAASFYVVIVLPRT
jgi:hypothetical protein